jgi:DNA-binding transcriptional LysR family regulator
MELRHLATFQMIVREGSFLRAAEKLQYAQSTITLHIQQLETELGVKLFARQGKKVQLTEAGRALRDQADSLLQRAAALQQAMMEITTGEVGRLRIGSIEPTASLRLPSLIAHFCHERPKVRLTVEVGGTSFVSQRVASGDLEVGICSPPSARLGLTFEPLFVEKMRLLLPADHPLTELESIRPADLAGQRFLLTEPGCAYRRVIEQELFQRGINPYSGIEIGSAGALSRLVQLGVGVAIVPAVIASPLPAEMVLRDVEGTDLSLPVGLVRRAEDHLPGQVVEALLVTLRTHLQEREKTLT